MDQETMYNGCTARSMNPAFNTSHSSMTGAVRPYNLVPRRQS